MKPILLITAAAFLIAACKDSSTSSTQTNSGLNDPAAPYKITVVVPPCNGVLGPPRTLLVKINGESFGSISPGDSLSVRAWTGRYFLDARDSAGVGLSDSITVDDKSFSTTIVVC